ncbi:hypothetical protein BDFB_006723 [Asbolus verrucosus]|uniref:Uncharacterized protein n=1 Tax=Asbolus verrucosus TaxID=1661398 RepID=A0A482VGT2_ASBVE|nr:hypothetical protein BDFB_006723 [Asbolus verrucosus]
MHEYVLRKVRNKRGTLTKDPPRIGFNLSDYSNHNISGNKLVNLKYSEEPSDAVNLEYIKEEYKKLSNKISNELSEFNGDITTIIDKIKEENIIYFIKPEIDIIKLELEQYQKDINLTATNRYIDIDGSFQQMWKS